MLLDDKKVVCANCGFENTITFPLSYSSFSSDLDTRPVGTARSAFMFEIQECKNCNYCYDNIETISPAAKQIVNSQKYQSIASNQALFAHAKKMFLAAIVLRGEQNFAKAAMYYLFAAWICDDFEEQDLAIQARQKSIEMFENISNPTIDNKLILLDIYRRTNQFEKCVEKANLILKNHSDLDKFFIDLINFQIKLCEKNDNNKYDLNQINI
jgi:hypothetical protein